MQIMPYYYIVVWSLRLHLLGFFLHPFDSAWTSGFGLLLTSFQDILWIHEWVKNGKGPADSNIS